MVVVTNKAFNSLLAKVKGWELAHADVIMHGDMSGDYEEIVLSFKNEHGDTKDVTFTSNWDHRKSDRDIIDTKVDVVVSETINTALIK